jgi:hypothetical protein
LNCHNSNNITDITNNNDCVAISRHIHDGYTIAGIALTSTTTPRRLTSGKALHLRP